MKSGYVIGILLVLIAAVGIAFRLKLTAAGISSDPVKSSPAYTNIDAGQLRDMVSKRAAMVVDVREPDEYAAGHIHDAVLIPLGTVQNSLSKLPHDRPIIVVCRSGRRSAAAADILVKAGFTQVYNLTGGMLAWPYEVVR